MQQISSTSHSFQIKILQKNTKFTEVDAFKHKHSCDSPVKLCTVCVIYNNNNNISTQDFILILLILSNVQGFCCLHKIIHSIRPTQKINYESAICTQKCFSKQRKMFYTQNHHLQ